ISSGLLLWSRPWWSTWKTSTVPTRLTGQTSSPSVFHVKSPPSKNLNAPNWRELFSGGETLERDPGSAVWLPQRNPFARFDDDAFPGIEFAIRFNRFGKPRVFAAVGIVLGNAVVVNRPNRDRFRELRRAAEMVEVEMRGHKKINLAQAGRPDRDVVDSFGIAPAWVAGIN